MGNTNAHGSRYTDRKCLRWFKKVFYLIPKQYRIALDITATVTLIIVAAALLRGPDNPDDSMVVSAVIVPDAIVGEDPPVIYNRKVYQDFYGRWRADVYPVEGANNAEIEPVCTGSGSALYKVSDAPPAPQGVTLAWYMGKECNLKAGVYFISTVWIVKSEVTIRNTSNVFTIREEGTGRYGGRPRQ